MKEICYVQILSSFIDSQSEYLMRLVFVATIKFISWLSIDVNLFQLHIGGDAMTENDKIHFPFHLRLDNKNRFHHKRIGNDEQIEACLNEAFECTAYGKQRRQLTMISCRQNYFPLAGIRQLASARVQAKSLKLDMEINNIGNKSMVETAESNRLKKKNFI